MSEVSLKAEARLGTGKGVARKLRADGKVPGTVYGKDLEPVAVSVNARELKHLLAKAGSNALIDLDVDGTKHLTLARDVQRNPVRNEILHIEFMAVSRNQEVVVDIPIHFVGKAAGERDGGVVEHVHNTLHAKAKATAVPEFIEVDISELTLDKPITVADITVPDGVEILTSEEDVVATCSLPKVVEEETAAEAPAEPELVGKEGEAEGEAAAEDASE